MPGEPDEVLELAGSRVARNELRAVVIDDARPGVGVLLLRLLEDDLDLLLLIDVPVLVRGERLDEARARVRGSLRPLVEEPGLAEHA